MHEATARRLTAARRAKEMTHGDVLLDHLVHVATVVAVLAALARVEEVAQLIEARIVERFFNQR